MDSNISIGEVIRFYRKKLSMSQDDLSKGICTREYIGKLERKQAIPSLNIINSLSERLGVNLYEKFTAITAHHDIHTHSQVVEITDALVKRDCNLLLSLIEKYQDLPSFQVGEPRQVILYAKCYHTAKANCQYEESVQLALAGLLVHFPSYEAIFNRNSTLSHVEMSMLLTLAVHYLHIGKKEDGVHAIDFMKECIEDRLPKSNHSLSHNLQFEINFYLNLIYTQYLFRTLPDKELMSVVDESLKLISDYHSNVLLVEFLFCKATLMKHTGNFDKANHYWHCAHYLGKVLYSQEKLDSIETLFSSDQATPNRLLPNSFNYFTLHMFNSV